MSGANLLFLKTTYGWNGRCNHAPDASRPCGHEEDAHVSQRSVERALGKMVTDPGFREAFFRDPAAASARVGLELTADELDALRGVPVRLLCSLARGIDDRICRLSIPDDVTTLPGARS